MINKDRIVPVTGIDLISLYALILNLTQNVQYTDVIKANGAGEFSCKNGTYIANEPLKTCNFTSTEGAVYFVPAYDYAGFTVGGEPATLDADGDEVIADGCTLYEAHLFSSGEVLISKIGF